MSWVAGVLRKGSTGILSTLSLKTMSLHFPSGFVETLEGNANNSGESALLPQAGVGKLTFPRKQAH